MIGNGDESQYVMIAFECKVIGDDPCADLDETIDLRFVASGEFGRLELSSCASTHRRMAKPIRRFHVQLKRRRS